MKRFSLAVLLVVFLCPNAFAIPYVYSFSGTVELACSDIPSVVNEQIGNKFTGYFSYDAELAGPEYRAWYLPEDVMLNVAFFFESFSYVYDGQHSNPVVYGEDYFDSSHFQIYSPCWVDIESGHHAEFHISFYDYSQTFYGDRQSFYQFNPSDFDYGWFGISVWGQPDYQGGATVVGSIDRITMTPNPVPEPSTIFLFGVGIIGLIGKRKFSKN